MERVFTQDVGRFKAGDTHDWPSPTWVHLSRSVGKPLDDFSEPLYENAVASARERARASSVIANGSVFTRPAKPAKAKSTAARTASPRKQSGRRGGTKRSKR